MADEQAGRLIRLGVAALAAVTSAFACSRLFGQGGTLVGTGVGAVISGAAAELYGHVMVKAKRSARAVAVLPRWDRRLAAELAAGGLLVAVAAYGVVWGVEAAAGRPLSAVTTGSSVRGNSFTGVVPGTPAPASEPARVVPSSSPAPSDTAPDATSPGPGATMPTTSDTTSDTTMSATPDATPPAAATMPPGPPDSTPGDQQEPQFQPPPPVTSSP